MQPPRSSTQTKPYSNASSRSAHTTLNRLITSRLPLALPPHTADPTLYTTGMLHFSYIFLTFESLWADIASTSTSPAAQTTAPAPPTPDPRNPQLSYLLVNPYANPSRFTSTSNDSPTTPSPAPVPDALLASLAHLLPPGLARSARLKRDLQFLTQLSDTDVSLLLSQYPGAAVQAFCEHVRDAVGARPWVLVAYAWCFYMAVFSGGRWIRGELEGVAAGGFWRGEGEGKNEEGDGEEREEEQEEEGKQELRDKGLSFWYFPGEEDGEDIKKEFKARLARAEVVFSEEQRRDIVEEAGNIFAFCEGVVEELDTKLGTDLQVVEGAKRGAAEKKGAGGRGGKVAVSGKGTETPLAWLRRPEVTGGVVALGCLVYVALAKLDLGMGW